MKHLEKQIKEELRTRGIELGIEEVEVLKNQVPCVGLRIINPARPDVSPIVYYSPTESLEEIMDKIFRADACDAPNFNLSTLTDPGYLADHLYLSITKRNGESGNILRRPYMNVDLIMKVALDTEVDPGTVSAKLTSEMLENAGLSEEAAWEFAKANSTRTATIRTMVEILQSMGFPVEAGDVPMYVASCNDGSDGAAVLALPDVFRRFCEEREMKELYILPSSTQELIILPADSAPETGTMVHLVDEINRGEVDPMIQLDPAVYIYRLSDNIIDIVEVLEEVN